jgi:hypothetical protein
MDWKTSIVLIAILVVSLSDAASDKLESDFYDLADTEIRLSHGFGTSQTDGGMIISPRGTLVIKNFKGPKYTIEQNPFSKTDLDLLEKYTREEGYYFLNASVMTPAGENTFHTFAPAFTLLESGLSDLINIHLTPTGQIFSIGYSMSQGDFQPKGSFPMKFNTTLSVHSGEHGPVPDTAQYLEKLEKERLAKERGDGDRDNRSFLAKYWMYIVPIALIVLLSSASQPEGQ